MEHSKKKEAEESSQDKLVSALEKAMARIDSLEKMIAENKSTSPTSVSDLKSSDLEPGEWVPERQFVTSVPSVQVKKTDFEEKVEGIFRNYEQPNSGAPVSFIFGPSSKIRFYKMVPGKSYSVPLAIAKNLEQGCSRPKYNYQLTEDKWKRQELEDASAYNPVVGAKAVGSVQRFGFTPVSSRSGW